jgi:hypothetical protein
MRLTQLPLEPACPQAGEGDYAAGVAPPALTEGRPPPTTEHASCY